MAQRCMACFLVFVSVVALLAACHRGPSLPAPYPASELVTLDRRAVFMGTSWRLRAICRRDREAEASVALVRAMAAVGRVERLASTYDPASELSRLNRNAGGSPVPVAPLLMAILEDALALARVTEGAFDPTFPPVARIWKREVRQQPPGEEEIRAALSLVGWEEVELDPAAGTVHLPRAGMALDLGGIAKGTGVDRALAELSAAGLAGGLVEGGGDLAAFGTNPEGEPWAVGIQDPGEPDRILGRFRLPLGGGGATTSGGYRKFVVLQGKRYSHIIDPRTGWPAEGLLSATVLAPTAQDADVWSTAAVVMGADVIQWIEAQPGVEAFLVTPEGEMRRTSGFPEVVIEPS